MKWGEDIAAGMEYISSRNLVHMDLAARNVLLGTQGINSEDYLNPAPGRLIAKISDFGLSKNLDNIQKEYYQIVVKMDLLEILISKNVMIIKLEHTFKLACAYNILVWLAGK